VAGSLLWRLATKGATNGGGSGAQTFEVNYNYIDNFLLNISYSYSGNENQLGVYRLVCCVIAVINSPVSPTTQKCEYFIEKYLEMFRRSRHILHLWKRQEPLSRHFFTVTSLGPMTLCSCIIRGPWALEACPTTSPQVCYSTVVLTIDLYNFWTEYDFLLVITA
jgi:hypothetical protein